MATPVRTINLRGGVLGYEAGGGVCSGYFCAYPYVVPLLNQSEEEDSTWREQLLGVDKSSMPGMVRMSFGRYNSTEDIDRLLDMLERMAAKDYQGDCQLDVASGEYLPVHYKEPKPDFLPLGMHST